MENVIGHDMNKCKKAPVVKYDSLYFLETVNRNSSFKGKLGNIMFKEETKRTSKFAKHSGLSKAVQFLKKIKPHYFLAETTEIKNKFLIGYDYLMDISLLNEHLALLLTNSNKAKFLHGAYSFRPNLSKSLMKSLDLERKLERIIFEGESMKDYHELSLLIKELNRFANNLRHFLEYLNIY